MTIITIGMAGAPDIKENAEKKETRPLHVRELEGKASKDYVEKPEEGELHWDEHFLNTTHWKKLPAGEWLVESKTKEETKHVNNELRDFLGGPAQVVRVRTKSDTGEITSIEVVWSEIALTMEDKTAEELISVQNIRQLQNIKSRDKREAEEKARELNEEGRDKAKKYVQAVEKASDHIQETLEKKFGKPQQDDFGQGKAIAYPSLLYKTPHGTTIRFFHEQKSMLVAVIEKSDVLAKRRDNLLLPEKSNTDRHTWAKANVVKSPNGDVVIHNIPMHNQGDRGYCAGTAYAMVLDYWGSPMPLELICNRYFVEGTWGRDAQTKAIDLDSIRRTAAKESNLDMASTRLSFRKLMKEIDAGRPIYIGRNFSEIRDILHTEWRENAKLMPKFEVPKFDSKDKRIVRATSSGHASLITGYNKEQEVVIFTDSWGEQHRNKRMTWDEWEFSNENPEMVTLEPTERAQSGTTSPKDIANISAQPKGEEPKKTIPINTPEKAPDSIHVSIPKILTEDSNPPPPTGVPESITAVPTKEYPFTPFYKSEKSKPSPECTLISKSGTKTEGTILDRVSLTSIRFRIKDSGKEIILVYKSLSEESIDFICNVLSVNDLPECYPGFVVPSMLVINPETGKEETWGETVVNGRTPDYYVHLMRKGDKAPIKFPFEFLSRHDRREIYLIFPFPFEKWQDNYLRLTEQELSKDARGSFKQDCWNGYTKKTPPEDMPWGKSSKYRNPDGTALPTPETNGEEESPNYKFPEKYTPVRITWKKRLFTKRGEKIEYLPFDTPQLREEEQKYHRLLITWEYFLVGVPPYGVMRTEMLTPKSRKILATHGLYIIDNSTGGKEMDLTLTDGRKLKARIIGLQDKSNHRKGGIYSEESRFLFRRTESIVIETIPTRLLSRQDRITAYRTSKSWTYHFFPEMDKFNHDEKFAEEAEIPIEKLNEELLEKNPRLRKNLTKEMLDKFPSLRKFAEGNTPSDDK
jgi:hypothetical protein